MLSCQSCSLPAMTKSIMTCGQQRATRMPALACTRTTRRLRRLRTVHYLPRTQAYPHVRGALHVTEHSEIFKHHIQTKKPHQIALLDMKYQRAADGARAELVGAGNFPDNAFWYKIGRVQSSVCSRQFFKLARD